MTQAIGYILSATNDAAKLEHQRQEITAYCERNGWSQPMFYADNGRSGRTLDRPGLQAALSAIKPGSVLLVTAADRLARSVNDLGIVKARMRKAGARLAET